MKTIRKQFIEKYGETEYKLVHKRMRKCFEQLGIDIKGKVVHCDAKEPEDYFFFYHYKLITPKEHSNIPEHKKANDITKIGRIGWNKNVPWNEKIKKKISKALQGKTHSEETKRKMSLAHKNRLREKKQDIKMRIWLKFLHLDYSLKELERIFNIPFQSISRYILNLERGNK